MSNSDMVFQSSMRDFIETDPLYRPIRVSGGFIADRRWPHKVTYWCPVDRAEKTFVTTSYSDVSQGIRFLQYKCADCEEHHLHFIIRGFLRGGDASQAFVEKIGQHPPLRIQPSAEMRNFLGEEHTDLYKKALVSLSQGYGLGALAYMRRVVEDKAREILELVSSLLEAEGADAEEVERIAIIAGGRVAQDILNEAATIFPDHLRPGGENPMAAIYDSASVAIHGLDESECVSRAKVIVKSMEYAIPVIMRQLEARRDYLESLRRLRGGE